MKIILVDDQQIVLQGLRYMITKYRTGDEIVGMFNDGEAALEYIKHHLVDVIITDIKMSRVSGIELIKEVYKYTKHPSILVLSGYGDYEFVREAMKIGVYDYLLKPCSKEALVENLIKIEHLKWCEQVGQILKEEGDQQNITNIEKVYSLYLFKNYDQEREIKESIKQIARQYPKGVACINLEAYLFILIEQDLVIGGLEELNEIFNKEINDFTKVSYFSYANQISINEAYKMCKKMMDFLEFNEDKKSMTYEEYRQSILNQTELKLDEYLDIKNLGGLILEGELIKVKAIIESTFNKFKKDIKTFEPKLIKKFWIKALINVEEKLGESVDLQQVGNRDWINQINECAFYRQLQEIVERYCQNLSTYFNKKREQPIYILDAIDYLEENYMKDISLKDVSEFVFLNPWYLSAQFKKYTGKSTREYLNHIRIKAAKKLLKEKDLMVYEVAELVGFHDATYFSTVFKSIEKTSPKNMKRYN